MKVSLEDKVEENKKQYGSFQSMGVAYPNAAYEAELPRLVWEVEYHNSSYSFIYSDVEQEMFLEADASGKEGIGKFLTRSKVIPQSIKDKNYVASCFTYWSDFELWKFCQGVKDKGELGFGAEMFSPSYEDY